MSASHRIVAKGALAHGKEVKVMEQPPCIGSPAEAREQISIRGAYPAGHRSFAGFLICLALLVAGFGVSKLWKDANGEIPFWHFGNAKETEAEGRASWTEEPTAVKKTEPQMPVSGTPIVSMDLSALSLGTSYLHNETPYTPSVEELLSADVSHCALSDGTPTVLVLHTHTSEAYLTEEQTAVEGVLGEQTYSRDEERNMLAVGRAFCAALQEKGITAIHCTVMLDSPSLRGAYDRSAEMIREYLKEYPEISYVIDLHRDALTDRDGNYIRTLATGTAQPTAQVMAVVGTDCNGSPCANWRENLALALQLREKLNCEGMTMGRPVSLRNASYQQGIATRHLLLEIGSGGNTVDEAIRAARRTAECFAELLLAQ